MAPRRGTNPASAFSKGANPSRTNARRQARVNPGAEDVIRLKTARGGQANRLQVAEIFTERLESRPGPWLEVVSTRVSRIRYDFGLRQIHVIFRDGTPWVYDQVPYAIWTRFQRTASYGRFINRVLNAYPYRRGEFTADVGS